MSIKSLRIITHSFLSLHVDDTMCNLSVSTTAVQSSPTTTTNDGKSIQSILSPVPSLTIYLGYL